MLRDVAGKVVVEPAHRDPARQQRLEGSAILIERDVQHGDLVAARGIDALKQRNVALDAGHDQRVAGLAERQLLQRAESVCVAVEYIEKRHGAS